MNRCVNIDWLQCFVAEPLDGQPRNAAYFMAKGYEVHIREYGTPQYKEMFTVFEHCRPFVEVRRNPYSLKAQGGIFNENDCHVRLSNRACYSESPINDLRAFLLAHGYEYKSLSRIDICLDFNLFDLGQNPANVLADYMRGKISKINQCNIAAHGKDSFKERLWNSISWGSPKSMISTKLYCKSLELKEVKDKFYIRDAWQAAGLNSEKPVWRVEFSIKSDLKDFVRVEDSSRDSGKNEIAGQLIPHRLRDYDNRDKCLFRFHTFAAHYFHFKYVEMQENGKPRRKDRCKDKVLFKLSADERAYKPVRLTRDEEPTRTEKLLMKYLERIINDVDQSTEVRNAAHSLMTYFYHHKRMKEYEKAVNDLMLFYDHMEKAVQ